MSTILTVQLPDPTKTKPYRTDLYGVAVESDDRADLHDALERLLDAPDAYRLGLDIRSKRARAKA